MLNDVPIVMTELAPKGPRFVEIIEMMDWPDIPFWDPNLHERTDQFLTGQKGSLHPNKMNYVTFEDPITKSEK